MPNHMVLRIGDTNQWPQSSELSAATRSPIWKDLTSSAMAKLFISWFSSLHGMDLYLTDNLTNGLVTRNERESGDKLALVDVKIGTANTAGLGVHVITPPFSISGWGHDLP